MDDVKPVERRRRYRLGPRTHHGRFGYLSVTQTLVCGGSGVLGLLILGTSRSYATLFLAVVVVAVGVAASFYPVGAHTPAEWIPILVAFLAGWRRRSWRSPALGAGVTHDGTRVEHPPALPPALSDVEIISVARRGGNIGLAYDRLNGTLSSVLRIQLRAFGLLSDEGQDGRLEGFGGILDDLARDGSPLRRLELLSRITPRQTNDLVQYINEARRVPLNSSSLLSLLQVIEQGAEIAQQHEVFLALQTPATVKGRGRQEERRRQAAVMGVDLLDDVARKLADAELAVESVDGALTPGALARMIKDSCDPFGRHLRDELELLLDHETGPEDAWPDVTDHAWGRYRVDSADHITWWVKGWPRMPVTAGFLQPLTLMCDTPVFTVAVVMEPIPTVRAMREATVRRTSDRVGAESRRRGGRITTSDHEDREDQSDRTEREIASGFSSWRWEAYVTASVPAGDSDALERAASQIESAAVRSHLHLCRMRGQQEEAFTFTLPLGRGLR